MFHAVFLENIDEQLMGTNFTVLFNLYLSSNQAGIEVQEGFLVITTLPWGDTWNKGKSCTELEKTLCVFGLIWHHAWQMMLFFQ